MPTKNGLPFIDEAIESILSQSLEEFEFLIIDDGSDEENWNFLQSLSDPRIRVIRNSGVGLVASLNTGLGFARTEFVARMDSDDVSMPSRFEIQYETMRNNTDCVVTYCNARIINEFGRQIGTSKSPTNSEQLLRCLTLQSVGQTIIHPSVLMRRDALERIGGYRAYLAAEDRDLWLRLMRQGTFIPHNEPLLRYRVHSKSQSRSKYKQQVINRITAIAAYEIYCATGADVYHQEREFKKLKRIVEQGFAQGFGSKIELRTKVRSAIKSRQFDELLESILKGNISDLWGTISERYNVVLQRRMVDSALSEFRNWIT